MSPKITSDIVNGLPADKKNITAYLYAGTLKYCRLNNRQTALYLYSTFSEPSANLMTSYNHYTNNVVFSGKVTFGNLDLGTITFNDTFSLQPQLQQGTAFYSYANYLMPDTTASWWIEGKSTFETVSVNVKRGYPVLNIDSASVAKVSKSGFTLDLSEKISNCDSLIVLLEDGWGGILIRKQMVTAGPVIFSKNDLAMIQPWQVSGAGYIDMIAINYSNKIIDDRVYVFALSRKYSQYVEFGP